MGTGTRRPGGNWSIRRADKLAEFQTVLYEIDMLRFAYKKVLAPWDGAREGDVWVYLESFLLHYRNLLDFFGKPPSYDTDLTIEHPDVIWTADQGLDARRPSPDVLHRMQAHQLKKRSMLRRLAVAQMNHAPPAVAGA